jgi:menaquinone-specific isochorismate synthase
MTMTAPIAAERLVARTVRLEVNERPDLVALAGDDGLLFSGGDVALAGRGEALRIEVADGVAGAADAVAEALDAIVIEDEVGAPGTGPVAIGALPFRRDRAGSLVVPRVLVGVDGKGHTWLTTIGVGRAPRLGLDALAPPAPRLSPDSFSLTSGQSHEDWCEMIATAVEALRGDRHGMEKVVLAREVLVEANRPIVPTAVLARLRALYPSCMLFSVDGFLGASPELLVSRFGRSVRSHPLAGTIAHSGDPAVDERMAAGLLADRKERHEHRVVVDAVAEALAPVCETLAVPDGPSIVSLRNVMHLGTSIEGTLRADDPPSALALVAALHPTPAVAGVPTKEALAYIDEAEPFDRGLYAGPVGWIDARGDGAFAVGIRSATVSGTSARLVAGDGIVADSVPEAELAETQLKLQALLAAVVRP